MNIYVSNLSFAVVDEDLRSYFAEYGEVTSAKVIMDKYTNRSKGFGFVEMSDDEAANKAIAELDGRIFRWVHAFVLLLGPRSYLGLTCFSACQNSYAFKIGLRSIVCCIRNSFA